MIFAGPHAGPCSYCGQDRRLNDDGKCFDCTDRSSWTEITRLERRVLELESVFRHRHVDNAQDDICKICGLDLRDAIHLRTEKGAL